ncbi:hypothetical protein A6R68_08564 [Neotoma lepida]|uniref:Uncharacterized protein n=1 Tax=Neotoma lepida TaxID=56216 RepID=A0A1A6G4M3_NEOLE|nr:hypothetical protein A6R68_08564 [Neotoma lepida]
MSNRRWRGRGGGSGSQPRGSRLVRCGRVRTAGRLAAGGTGRRLQGLAESHEPPALQLGPVAPEALVCDSMCGLALR